MPDGFDYPLAFIRVVELGLTELEPWRILQGHERPESGSFLASVLAEGSDPNQIRFYSAEVLRVVLGYGEADWPALDEWRRVLPHVMPLPVTHLTGFRGLSLTSPAVAYDFRFTASPLSPTWIAR